MEYTVHNSDTRLRGTLILYLLKITKIYIQLSDVQCLLVIFSGAQLHLFQSYLFCCWFLEGLNSSSLQIVTRRQLLTSESHHPYESFIAYQRPEVKTVPHPTAQRWREKGIFDHPHKERKQSPRKKTKQVKTTERFPENK